MKYFMKSVSPNDPVMKPIMDAFGFDGYGRFCAVLDHCQTFNIETLDIELIAKCARSNRKGALKYLAIFQETLDKVMGKFTQSYTKVYPKFTQSLPKVEGQNPHGSTREEEENRTEEKRRDERENACSSDSQNDFLKIKFVTDAKNYAIGSGNVNLQNFSWLDGYLTQQFSEIRNSRPDIPAEAVLKIWQECCDDASSRAVGSPKWYRSVFENRIAEWSPSVSKPVGLERRTIGTMIAGNAIVPSEARQGRSGKL